MNLHFDNPAITANFLRGLDGFVCGIHRVSL
jgi:hypothetical protein